MGEQAIDRGRLRWRCMRRGLLELDIVFDRFLARHFDSLDPRQLRALDALLDYEDIELWEMVSGRRDCDRPDLGELIGLMRGAESAAARG